MAGTYYLRVWQNVDIESVKRHLMIVGDLTGDCASCRSFGIKYIEARQCPECKTPFHFVALRTGSSLRSAGPRVKRIKEQRPDLTFIDYEDFRTVTGKLNARDILG